LSTLLVYLISNYGVADINPAETKVRFAKSWISTSLLALTIFSMRMSKSGSTRKA